MIALFSGRLDRNERVCCPATPGTRVLLAFGLQYVGRDKPPFVSLSSLRARVWKPPILWVGLKVPWVEVQEWGVSKWILRRRNGERENTPSCMVFSDTPPPQSVSFFFVW